MRSRITKSVLAAAAVTAIAIPAVAQARHGADDPVGHVRHAGEVHHRHHHARHHHRVGDDHGRHGADDGPNHR